MSVTYHHRSVWAGGSGLSPLPGGSRTRGQELSHLGGGCGARDEQAGSGSDESEEFTAQPPRLPWPETRVSPCRGINFTCFLICWSNRVRSVGKAKIAFKFPDSLRRLLSVYDVVTAPKLMHLLYSPSSECTEQGYTTKKVYKKRNLPRKPKAKMTRRRYAWSYVRYSW